jgi:hypothetical protein
MRPLAWYVTSQQELVFGRRMPADANLPASPGFQILAFRVRGKHPARGLQSVLLAVVFWRAIIAVFNAGGEDMGWFSKTSAIFAKPFRSERYKLLFDRQVQQRMEREFPDHIRENHDFLSRYFDDAGEARAAAVASQAQYLVEECLDTALRRNGWGTPTYPLHRLEKRQGYGMLYVSYEPWGQSTNELSCIAVYKQESIKAHVWWCTSPLMCLSDASSSNVIVSSDLQSIESEFRRKG